MSARKIILPVVGVSLIGAGAAYFAYKYVNREKDEEDEESTRQASPKSGKTLEVEVPRDAVPIIIGRGGSVVKELQDKTECRITFRDDNPANPTRTILIRGDPDNCEMARLRISELVEIQALVDTETIQIPSASCGKIIGRGGETIQKIMYIANAKITVDPKTNDNTETRSVHIRGTPDQREMAISIIEEMVADDNAIREILALRKPRGPPKSPEVPEVPAAAVVKPDKERFVEKGQVDGQIEVYVSAVDDPGKFWVQIYGPKATELDELVEDMTDYYSVEENCKLNQLSQVQIGDLVAAQFEFDKKWYRTEVTKIKQNPKDSDDELLELYYVDYGDTATLPKSTVFELRTDFLKLRFQAIECFMADIEPRDTKWSNEAILAFDDLTHVAKWKKLNSKVVQYKEREREGSPIPGVYLYDYSGDTEINVGDEMVKKGFGKYENSLHQSPKLLPKVTPIVPLKETPIVPPKETPIVPPKETPIVPPKETPIVPPKETPIVPPKETPIVPLKETPIVPPKETPIVPPEEESESDSDDGIITTIEGPIEDVSPKLVIIDTDDIVPSVDVTSPGGSSVSDLSFSTPMNKTLNNNATVIETNGNVEGDRTPVPEKKGSAQSFLDNERGGGDAPTPLVKKQLFDQNKF